MLYWSSCSLRQPSQSSQDQGETNWKSLNGDGPRNSMPTSHSHVFRIAAFSKFVISQVHFLLEFHISRHHKFVFYGNAQDFDIVTLS